MWVFVVMVALRWVAMEEGCGGEGSVSLRGTVIIRGCVCRSLRGTVWEGSVSPVKHTHPFPPYLDPVLFLWLVLMLGWSVVCQEPVTAEGRVCVSSFDLLQSAALVLLLSSNLALIASLFDLIDWLIDRLTNWLIDWLCCSKHLNWLFGWSSWCQTFGEAEILAAFRYFDPTNSG